MCKRAFRQHWIWGDLHGLSRSMYLSRILAHFFAKWYEVFFVSNKMMCKLHTVDSNPDCCAIRKLDFCQTFLFLSFFALFYYFSFIKCCYKILLLIYKSKFIWQEICKIKLARVSQKCLFLTFRAVNLKLKIVNGPIMSHKTTMEDFRTIKTKFWQNYLNLIGLEFVSLTRNQNDICNPFQSSLNLDHPNFCAGLSYYFCVYLVFKTILFVVFFSFRTILVNLKNAKYSVALPLY